MEGGENLNQGGGNPAPEAQGDAGVVNAESGVKNEGTENAGANAEVENANGGDQEKLTDAEKLDIATALRMGHAANKAAELTDVEFGRGKEENDINLILANTDSKGNDVIATMVEKKLASDNKFLRFAKNVKTAPTVSPIRNLSKKVLGEESA